MKTNKIVIIVFMVCNFVSSCKTENKNNIILTDFTKELISLYINDIKYLGAKNRKDEIIIISVADTLYYYISIFANNSKEYIFCRDDFVGQTLYLEHLIRVFGDDASILYSIKEKNKNLKKCKQDSIVYDPSVWQVCFHKDLSFCKMKTYRVLVDEDISAIQNLAKKYFNVCDTTHERSENGIYQWNEVENSPAFALGEDSLRHLIFSNFEVKSNDVQGKIPVVVDILIDTNGKATLSKISKSSNNTEIDNEALRVAEIVCQYEFISASHRGEKVNTLFPVVFLRNDIVP
jgi:TonB family protein